MPKYPENFIHRGKEFEFWYVTGEVIGTNKFSETHVTSSGGGGYVGGYVGTYGGSVGGTISAPQIHSEVITNHEFWILTEEGKEVSVKLSGYDIPLRSGQVITVFSAYKKGKDSGWYCFLFNHSADRYWFINDAKGLNKALKIETPTGFSILIALAFITGGFFILREIDPYRISGLWELMFGAAAVFVVYRMISKFIRAARLRKRLQKHLDEMVRFAAQNLQNPQSFTAADALKAAKAAQEQALKSGTPDVVSVNIDKI